MPADDRAVVKTYVPADQKAAWADHADELDMNQSEFLRCMVQAGRRGFDLDPVETRSPPVTPGVDGLRDRVLAVLADGGYVGFDALVDELTADLEARVDDLLATLVAEGRVRHRNVEGGYALVDAPENGVGDGDD